MDIKDLGKEVEGTLYVELCIANEWEHNIDTVQVNSFSRAMMYKDSDTERYVLLAEKTVKIKIPPFRIDKDGELLQMFEEQKTKELAEHEVKMNSIQKRIDNLLAIECKGE